MRYSTPTAKWVLQYQVLGNMSIDSICLVFAAGSVDCLFAYLAFFFSH